MAFDPKQIGKRKKRRKKAPPEKDDDEAEALPVEDDGDEAEALPVEDDGDEAEALPVEDDDDEVEALPVEDDEADCKILQHRKSDGEMDVLVEYADNRQWEKLYDMWADYPQQVEDYRRSKKLRAKCFKKPTWNETQYIVRVIGHTGSLQNLKNMQFVILFDNGFKQDDVSYDNVKVDVEDLLNEYLNFVRAGI